MWVDIDPADAHLIGWTHVGFTEQRDDLVPAGTTWIAATVTCDTVAGASYAALVPDGYTTDAGHLLPRFDHAALTQLVADLDAIHANPDRNSDQCPASTRGYACTATCTATSCRSMRNSATASPPASARSTVDLIRPDADGRFSVGAYGWLWRLADPGR